MSTGKCTKDGTSKGASAIRCLEFDPSGTLLWAGDEKVCIVLFLSVKETIPFFYL